MPSQRSLRRDRAINLSLMNTVNVVFHVSYVTWFDFLLLLFRLLIFWDWRSEVCLSRSERQWNYQRTWNFQANTQMFTISPSEIGNRVVVFDNLQICHKQPNSQSKDNILKSHHAGSDWLNLNAPLFIFPPLSPVFFIIPYCIWKLWKNIAWTGGETISFSFWEKRGDKERLTDQLVNYEEQGECDRLKDSYKNRGWQT